MKRLVILRPEPGAKATTQAARRLGLDAAAMPLFSVQPVDWATPDPNEFDALLLTSANAIRHGGDGLDRLRSLPAHCVGDATAATARDAGFSIGTIGSSGVDALLETLPPDLRLLHLHGADRREPEGQGQTIRGIIVYRAAELPTPDALAELADCVVAVHSPRAAARFSGLATAAGLARQGIAIAAISDEAAAAAGVGWGLVAIAAEPSDSALLALAASLCNNRS